MRNVVVVNNITLDGVMQSPAAKDEDPRGGFQHGGWAAPYNDDVKGREMGKGMAREGVMSSESGPMNTSIRSGTDGPTIHSRRSSTTVTNTSRRRR